MTYAPVPQVKEERHHPSTDLKKYYDNPRLTS